MAVTLLAAPWAVADTANQDIAVDVSLDGDAIIVHVDCPVAAPVESAWDVITDYDHMARFLTHLESSRAETLDGAHRRVYQQGVAVHGPFRFRFSNTRDVELAPNSRVHAIFISGDLRLSRSDTFLISTPTGSRIVNEGRFVSNTFVPPLIGPAVIAVETKREFEEIRTEILRRARAQHTEDASPTPAAGKTEH